MVSAAKLHEEAKQATNAGQHELALGLIERARGLSEDPTLCALLDGTAAYAQVERGQLQAARELCDSALEREIGADTRGVLLGQRAIVFTRSGQVTEALADFEAAERLLGEHPEFRGRVLLNRGTLYLDRGDASSAARDFAAASESFRTAGLATQRAKAEHNLGYALMLTGDLVPALEHMTGAQRELSGLSVVSRAIGRMDHAEALFLSGLSSEGEAELRSAIADLTAAGARRVATEARYALARHLAYSDPAAASRLAGTASRAYAAMGAARQARSAKAIALGCRLRLGRPIEREALALADELRAAEQTYELDFLMLNVFAARLASGRLAKVRGLKVPRPNALAHRLLAADVAATRAEAAGRPRAALTYLAAALDEAQAVRARVGSLDLATSLSNRTRALSLRGIALSVASGDAELAYAWLERARAHASRIVPVRRKPGDESVRDLAELRHLELSGTDPARQAELRMRIREASWAQVGAGWTRPVATSDEVAAGLAAEHAALVSHVVVDGRVWAIVVAKAPVLLDCGPAAGLTPLLHTLAADLDVAASPLGAELPQAVHDSLAATLAALSSCLIDPVLETLDDRRLVLTPSAGLHQLPWGLLPSLRGHGVTVARSATAWLATGAVRTGKRIVGIAGPGLQQAEAEVRAVAAGGQVLSGPDADVGSVLSAMGSCDIAHVAAHGRHIEENPLFSRLDLADGPLFGYDLDGLDHPPGLVVLSACDVGSRSVRGDDLLGLPTALLHAGVQTVVASVARAGDASARTFAEAMHHELASGQRVDEAVAAAIASGGRAVAPFVCMGRA